MILDVSKIPKEKLTQLADEHINRFERMMKSGSRNVRASECEMYIDIWKSIREKISSFGSHAPFTKEEQSELDDAYMCGDYEDLLGCADAPEEASP